MKRVVNMNKKIVILIIICFLLGGCGKGVKEITIEDFKQVCTDNNLLFMNEEIDKTNNTSICSLVNGNITMTIYDSAKKAKKESKNNIDKMNEEMSKDSKISNKNGKYVMESDLYYMINLRVDNTIIYASSTSDDKDIIDKIFREIGY